MSLKTLVQSRLNMSDAEIATELNTASIERRDTTRYTWAGLVLKFGTVTVATMRAALNAVPNVGPLVTEILTSTGVDFSLDETQGMLDSLAPTLGANAVAGLKSIGRQFISPYNADGNLGTVTEQEVAAARLDYITRRDAGVFWSAVQNQIGQMIDAGNTVEEIKAALGDLL